MKRHALFVGVDNYADENIQDLHCAVNDATELAGFFKHRARFDRAEALPNPRNCEAILDRVYDMISGLGGGDEFLFFFAGHGIKTQDGHRLVCAGDKLNAVKHSWAGLPLERIKSETLGAFSRLFLLDACRTDVLATNRGVAGVMEQGTRDLIMGAATSANEDVGALTILCSCNDGECAGEILKHRHGLFSMAMLELLEEECSRGRRVFVTDDFVYNQIPTRMRALAEKSDMAFNQKPQKEGPPILLLDGFVVDGTVSATSSSTPMPPPGANGEDVVVEPTKTLSMQSLTGNVHVGNLAKLFVTNSCQGNVLIEHSGMLQCSVLTGDVTVSNAAKLQCSALTGDVTMKHGADLKCDGLCYGNIEAGDACDLSISRIIGNVHVGRVTDLICKGACYGDVIIGEAGSVRCEELKGNVLICANADLVCEGSLYGNVEIGTGGSLVCKGSLVGDIVNHGGSFEVLGKLQGKVTECLGVCGDAVVRKPSTPH